MAIDADKSTYGSRTVTGAGWPHVDEDTLFRLASAFEHLATHLRNTVVPSARGQKDRLSSSWEGTSAQAALKKAQEIIDKHDHNGWSALGATSKLVMMGKKVVEAKNEANKTAARIQRECEEILDKKGHYDSNSEDSPDAQADNHALSGRDENIRMVAKKAIELGGELGVPPGTPGADGQMPPPRTAAGQTGEAPSPVDRGTEGQAPSPQASPAGPQTGTRGDTSEAPSPVDRGTEGQAPRPQAQAAQQPGTPDTAHGPAAPAITPGGAPGAPSASGAAQGLGVSPMSVGGSKTDGASAAKAAGDLGNPAAAGAQPPNPFQQLQQNMADAAKAGGSSQPMSANPSQPLGTPATTQPLNAPAAGAGAPPAPGAAPAAAAAQAAGSMGGAGNAPVGAGGAGAPAGSPMPLGAPPTPPPAGQVPPPAAPAAGGPVPPANPAATATAGGAQVAPVPVSAARRQSEVVASALRRESGTDPVQIARRIAAALNAPPSIPRLPWKFGWAVGLTAEGSIIVANTFGMAYIPKGVNLPEPVKMVSADESIPAGERAKWVAYPYLALQGWAQHNEQNLRVVFGTEQQLQGIDPGAQKVVLTAADIPENGEMQGRSRLQIVAPDVAGRLAALTTAGLTDVLPPRPADDTPPEDRSDQLWFDMIKPLMRSGTGTDVAHLEAFVTYVTHEQELALHRAHTGSDGDLQRTAIEDWIYWQHVGVLVSDALVGAAPAEPPS